MNAGQAIKIFELLRKHFDDETAMKIVQEIEDALEEEKEIARLQEIELK